MNLAPTNGFFLITTQMSRDNRASWQTWNSVIRLHPALWLASVLAEDSELRRVGYTDIVLLNAIELTFPQYEQLKKVLDEI